jgi:hypothetical protein
VSTTSGQEIRGWIQIAAILIAGIWGAYEFIYKEIVAPSAAPINVSLDLELKLIDQVEAGSSNTRSRFPVQLKVVARNPSTRSIYLLSSAWWVYGIDVAMRETDEKEFDKSVASSVSYPSGQYAERYVIQGDPVLVAAGSLVADVVLKPAEIITRSLIIYLPPKHDKLEVVVKIPTSEKNPEGKVKLLWDNKRNWTLYSSDKIYSGVNLDKEFGNRDSAARAEISLR